MAGGPARIPHLPASIQTTMNQCAPPFRSPDIPTYLPAYLPTLRGHTSWFGCAGPPHFGDVPIARAPPVGVHDGALPATPEFRVVGSGFRV